MKKSLLAAALLGLLATEASAQGYGGYGPPPGWRPPPPPQPYYQPAPQPGYGAPPGWRHRQAYGWCQQKAERLHYFEYQAAQDGRVTKDEARIARSLRADLANSCGGGRWAPNRGWHYR